MLINIDGTVGIELREGREARKMLIDGTLMMFPK
jgi:hypothetical protein